MNIAIILVLIGIAFLGYEFLFLPTQKNIARVKEKQIVSCLYLPCDNDPVFASFVALGGLPIKVENCGRELAWTFLFSKSFRKRI